MRQGSSSHAHVARRGCTHITSTKLIAQVSKEQKGADQMILIAPNCRSAADTKAMQRLAEHLKRSCDAANVKVIPNTYTRL